MINVTVCDKNSRRRIVINYVADSSIIIQDSNSSIFIVSKPILIQDKKNSYLTTGGHIVECRKQLHLS